MTHCGPQHHENIAGVRLEVVSVLPPEDRAFLRMLASMGLTLDGVIERITQKNDLTRCGISEEKISVQKDRHSSIFQ